MTTVARDVSAAVPVMLVRYRSGVTGETARVVHVVPLPANKQAGPVGALCGVVLAPGEIETVTPGVGMPCCICLVRQVTNIDPCGEPPTASPDRAGVATAACYQRWGWPVILDRDQVRLSLSNHVSALAVPIPLCTRVIEILTQRRCAPAALAHPYMPDHHIVLAEEGYGVTLPWPAAVHRVSGTLLLPPTCTARGPITWTRPPQPNSLALCREIDLFAALRTTLPDISGQLVDGFNDP